MKFRFTPKYSDDYLQLGQKEKNAVFNAKDTIAKALQGDLECRSKHRLQKMEGRSGIWEGHVKIDLVFTYHFQYENDIKICYFRRVGTHDIYKSP